METFTQAFAKRFRYFLETKKISQYSIWQTTGIYPSTINSILNAKFNSINSKTIVLLVKACGVSLSEFFDDKVFDYNVMITEN